MHIHVHVSIGRTNKGIYKNVLFTLADGHSKDFNKFQFAGARGK